MTQLRLQNVGPIEDADIEFGDLTVLVGPQATGKSIFLQFLKALIDTGLILRTLKEQGIDWKRKLTDFLDVFLGEGMSRVWRSSTSQVTWNGQSFNMEELPSRQARQREDHMFFIPAQRVLTLGKGWPRNFSDYSPGDPFTVRDFSEKIRRLIESEMGQGASIFPQSRRLKKELREVLTERIFAHFGLQVDSHGPQKRLVLNASSGNGALPFMVWSAGQREFVPLLLGLYWLLPPTKTPTRGRIEWVVIEELEMGLHPQAISAVLLLVLDLLSRGYRVCLSTHSPHVLELVWAMRVLKAQGATNKQLLSLFDVKPTHSLLKMAEKCLTKTTRVYFFNRHTRRAEDISSLDPSAANPSESDWGGLTEFAGRVTDLVAQVVSGRQSGEPDAIS